MISNLKNFSFFEGKLTIRLIVLVTILAAGIFLWLAQFDTFYRTIFIEEFHSGEAGRAAFLFGDFLGEGGGYQSKIASPTASLMSWLSFELFGLGRFQLRLPFVLLSVASMAAFGFTVRREIPRHPFLAVSVLLAFVLSPFLINLRPTSTNETLFVPVLAFSLTIAAAFESSQSARARLLLAFSLAFCAGLAVFVKFDGAIIPAAVSLVFLSGLRPGWVSLKELGAFAAGGFLVLGAYIATQLWGSGLEQLQGSLEWGGAAMAGVSYWPDSPLEQFTRTVITAPKNMNLFFPGISMFLLAMIVISIVQWRALSLVGKISAAIIIAFFAAAPFLPLIYWKRMLFAAPAAFYLAISICGAWERLSLPQIARIQRIMSFVIPASILIGMIAITSPFKGMWHVQPFGQMGAKEISLLLLGLLGAAAFIPLKLDRVRLHGIVLAISAATIMFGLLELSIPRGREAATIGQEIDKLTRGSFVVGDHNAFRVAGYFTNARFAFVHENDPGFPNLIIEQAVALQPEFIVVTDSYSNLGSMVRRRLPNYDLVLEREFENPPSYFRRRSVAHPIYVFERTRRALENSQ